MSGTCARKDTAAEGRLEIQAADMREAFIIGLPPRLDATSLPTETLSVRAGLNSGNLVYAHAIVSHLGEDLRILDIGAPPEQMNRAGGIGVVQGANQLGAHFTGHQWADRFEQLTVKLVVIGLGAQSDIERTAPDIPESALNWVRRIVERAPGNGPNLGVRGQFTMEVLRRHGLAEHAELTGCPSLFISPAPSLGRAIEANLREPRRVAVVAGHEEWRHLAKIEASLGRLVSETGGAYIGQHGLGMMKLTRGEARDLAEEDLEALGNYICPRMGLAEFIRWSRAHGTVFFDVPEWMNYYKAFDFVIGTRIHGTMLALQAGVPALCIAHDSRTLELCETMRMPHVTADAVRDGVTRDELVSLFDFDPVKFDENRRALCGNYVAFLKRNDLRPVPWLEDIAHKSP